MKTLWNEGIVDSRSMLRGVNRARRKGQPSSYYENSSVHTRAQRRRGILCTRHGKAEGGEDEEEKCILIVGGPKDGKLLDDTVFMSSPGAHQMVIRDTSRRFRARSQRSIWCGVLNSWACLKLATTAPPLLAAVDFSPIEQQQQHRDGGGTTPPLQYEWLCMPSKDI